MYLKISNCMKVISLKIFVEGYLATAVRAEDGRQSWALLQSQKSYTTTLLQVWSPDHNIRITSGCRLKMQSHRQPRRLNELEFLGAGPKNFRFSIQQGFCVTSNIDRGTIHL